MNKEQLLEERARLLAKWQVRGLWIWEKLKLDRIDDQIREIELARQYLI